jgi:DNA (cytosine-5)-methyltransferase 1
MTFIDLTAGKPQITDTARCLKANYNNGIQQHKGEKSGVLLVSDAQQHAPNAVFVDMTIGNPQITDTARCITANYGKSGMSHHNGELSGVLLIKKGTKKGYTEASPGDSITLNYLGSGGRRGRVGKGVTQTLTCQPQGVMECYGRIRRLTPRECFRIQGFDEAQIDRVLAVVSDSQAYKQAGNSVTVNVVHAIGLKLRSVHEEFYTEGGEKAC